MPVRQRRFDIVPQRSGQRAFEAGFGIDRVEQPVTRLLRRAGERGHLAVQRRQRRERGRACGFGGVAFRSRLRLAGVCPLQRPARLGRPVECRRVAAARVLQRRLDPAQVIQRIQCLSQLRRIAAGAIEAGRGSGLRRGGDAPLGGFRRLRGQRLCQRHLDIAGMPLRIGQRGVERRGCGGGGSDRAVERGHFIAQAGQRGGRIMRQRVFPRAILRDTQRGGVHLGQPALQTMALFARAAELVRDLARAVARRQCLRARRRQPLDRVALFGGGALLQRGGRDHRCVRRRRLRFGCFRRLRRLAPAGEDHARLRDADLIGQQAIAFRGARLASQCRQSGGLVCDQFVDSRQIGLGGAQPGFGLLAADVQSGDSGRFLQHRAAFGGARGDDRADPVLADQRGAVRAGGRIGEQQLHVARTHVASVDPIGRPGAAFDPAHHLTLRHALGTGHVGEQRHFREIARRAGRGAGEDDVVHAGAAHRLGAVLPHRPAQRLEQVRLAAAIGADDARQPRLDQQIGRVDEAFETRQPQPLDPHRGAIRPRRSSARPRPPAR